jgi:hypothetical protein
MHFANGISSLAKGHDGTGDVNGGEGAVQFAHGPIFGAVESTEEPEERDERDEDEDFEGGFQMR